jgi:hypothetical protein
MKITEVIHQLQQILAEEGDIDCFVEVPRLYDGAVSNVCLQHEGISNTMQAVIQTE